MCMGGQGTIGLNSDMSGSGDGFRVDWEVQQKVVYKVSRSCMCNSTCNTFSYSRANASITTILSCTPTSIAQCGSCVVQVEPLLLCYQLALRLNLDLQFLLFFLLLVVTLQHGSFLKPHTLSSVQCLARIEPHIYFAHTSFPTDGVLSCLCACPHCSSACTYISRMRVGLDLSDVWLNVL